MPGSSEPDDAVEVLHDVHYAARRLGTNTRYVYDAASAGLIKHYKLSRKTLRFSDAQIDEFLAAREVSA